MKRLIIFLAAIAIISLFFVSCYYDNEEVLYPSFNAPCDTINPVTFSGTIQPMIQNSCSLINCHSGPSPSGNVPLGSYSDVATIAANGLLIKALKGTGVIKMPPGGKLKDCSISQIEIWIRKEMP